MWEVCVGGGGGVERREKGVYIYRGGESSIYIHGSLHMIHISYGNHSRHPITYLESHY